jgi:outer membrane protein OmpA-like peptidoglycan-associated protein
MSRWIVFAGITAMLVTGYFATFYDRGQGPLRAVKFMPAELKAKVELALKAHDAKWAHVEMDGQKAILSGTAPSELDRDDALEVVRHAAGPGGTVWGGITKVDGEAIRIEPSQSPYRWSAQRGDHGSVSLRGYAPSRQFKLLLVAEARKLFPGGVDDQMAVASGQPTGDWVGTALHGLHFLTLLSSGQVQLEDARLTILGQAADDKARLDIDSGFASVKRPFEAVVSLSAESPTTATPVDHANDDAPPVDAESVQRLPAADCQTLIDKALRDNVIRFAAKSADVDAAGARKAAQLAETAVTCPDLKLKVTGHADTTTETDIATDISRQRAIAAARLLTAKGVESDRMVVVGVGATQPDPDAALTDAAANRRVEFSVIP